MYKKTMKLGCPLECMLMKALRESDTTAQEAMVEDPIDADQVSKLWSS